jgi:hypothetical protein
MLGRRVGRGELAGCGWRGGRRRSWLWRARGWSRLRRRRSPLRRELVGAIEGDGVGGLTGRVDGVAE